MGHASFVYALKGVGIMDDKVFAGLIQEAKQVECESYSPLTNRSSGVALLAKGGKIYTGCSIEVSNYASSICAGKAALAKAISDGARQFLAVAITGETVDLNYLCGDCREAFAEFGRDLVVISELAPKEHKLLSELLPV
jgi:cytidine deaminase